MLEKIVLTVIFEDGLEITVSLRSVEALLTCFDLIGDSVFLGLKIAFVQALVVL